MEEIINYLKDIKPNDWEYWLDIYNSEESIKFNQNLKNKARKFARKGEKSYLWLTLSPDKYLRNMDNNIDNLNGLKHWCMKWFDNNPIHYGDYAWVVENGSQGDHLHVHAILEMKDAKHHARNLKRSWAKHFPNNQLMTSVDASSMAYRKGKKGEYCYANFKDPLILSDKLDYLINEKKGCHENHSDTGVRGSRGFNLT